HKAAHDRGDGGQPLVTRRLLAGTLPTDTDLGIKRAPAGRALPTGASPAFAGSITSVARVEPLPRGHPRVCGDHMLPERSVEPRANPAFAGRWDFHRPVPGLALSTVP